MSAALTPPPTPAAGATQGMAMPQADVRQRFMMVSQAMQQFMLMLTRLPGVNQQLVTQARTKIGEAVQLIAQAMQQTQGQPGAPPPPSPSATPPPH